MRYIISFYQKMKNGVWALKGIFVSFTCGDGDPSVLSESRPRELFGSSIHQEAIGNYNLSP